MQLGLLAQICVWEQLDLPAQRYKLKQLGLTQK